MVAVALAALLLLITTLAMWRLIEARTVSGVAQPEVTPGLEAILTPGATLGQSFVARHSALTGIELFVTGNATSGTGSLVATLLASPDSTEILGQQRIPLDAVPSGGLLHVDLPTVPDSLDSSFFLRLEMEGVPAGASLTLGAGGPLAYPDGALYMDGQPQDRQLRFRLLHEGGGYLRDLAAFGGDLIRLSLVATLLFVLPGYTLLLWLAPDFARERRVAVLASPAISLALYPLLYLWLDPLPIPIGRPFIWGVAGISLILLFYRRRSGQAQEAGEAVATRHERSSMLALAGLLLLLAFSRLWPIHILEGPSWGDSVQHAVMTQVLVEQQGLFEDWRPYAPYRSLTTHYGFSVAAALFQIVTGTSTLQSTLIAGQLLNLFAILALYPLAFVATRSHWAALVALLVAGLLSPLPAEYVNWGRYAQLAGQVILPVAIALFWTLLSSRRLQAGTALLGGMILAGMALNYYRMPVVWALFFIVWGILYAIPTWRTDVGEWRRRLLQAGITGAISLLLLSPWLLNLSGSALQEGIVEGMTAESPWQRIVEEYRIWLDLDQYLPRYLQGLAVLSLLVALVRRARWPLLLALWTLILASVRATQLWGLPLAHYIQMFAVVIMLYIPLALLVGWLGGVLASAMVRGERAGAGAALLLLAVGAWGTLSQQHIVKKEYMMLTRPDLEAMAWIKENVPEDARFLVNGFTIYAGTSAVGADAGWWIPLLAHRANTMPPQYALLNEQPIEPDYSNDVVDLVAALEAVPPVTPAALQPLCPEEVTHVYSGQELGLIGVGLSQLLDPIVLENNPGLRLIYHKDQVRIFELDPGVCANASGN